MNSTNVTSTGEGRLPQSLFVASCLYGKIKRVQPWLKTATTLTSLLLIATEGRAQSALDGFDPGTNGTVYATAVQADGKILVAGGFSTVGGGGTGTTARNNIARLNADGTIDTSFNPGASENIYTLAVQTDGKILIGGDFVTVGGGGTGTTARNKIARLNADGTLDTSFNPGANAAVFALAVQADGKILVGGDFATVGGGGTGTTARNKIARLNPGGTLDTSFNPGANFGVFALALQADAKIVVGGSFTTLGGGGTGTTTRNGIGRLNVNGSLDASFNPGTDDSVFALAVQADDKIVVGGFFATLGGGGTGTTARNNIGRLNADGSLDSSFNPGADDLINTLVVQADGRILAGGFFSTLGGGGTGTFLRSKIGRLRPDGVIDTSFDPGANNSVFALAVQPDDKILVGGTFTALGGGSTGITTRNRIARVNPDATLDAHFDPGANGAVNALAVQADSKVVVGGAFTTLGGGGTGTNTRNKIGRLSADGTFDGFNPGANGAVNALAMQADGRVLVGGDFTIIDTITRNFIARLNVGGAIHSSFDPGANNGVSAFAIQADGKIVVGGTFTTLGGGGTGSITRNNIGRLNADGTPDNSFNPGANAAVDTLAVQADGKILVGGSFTTLGGGGTGTTTRNYIGRLNADGSLDTSFNPGANFLVYSLAVQADGKILVGGAFTGLGGGTGTTARSFIGRLNSDGSLDPNFNPGANSGVNAMAVQADGKILLGGLFGTLGGGGTGTTTRQRIGRLHPDGTLDTSFNPGANSAGVNALTIQADGKIVVGGAFTTLGGGGTGTTARNKIGRLTNTNAALQQLAADTNGSTITWTRSGAAAEVDRVTFELSTDGTNYSLLANPIRISGGWQLTGQSLPVHQNIFIRARGFYSTCGFGGSGSIVGTVRNAFISPPPVPTSIVSQKPHGTSNFGITLPLTGAPGVECRTGGESGYHQVIATFAGPVTFTFAAVTSGTGSVANASAAGNQVTVDLLTVANAQIITITLFGLSDGANTGNLGIPMGVLLGDTGGNGSVNASDVSLTKLKSGQAVDATNFRADVTVSNSINATDISLVKSKSGTALP